MRNVAVKLLPLFLTSRWAMAEGITGPAGGVTPLIPLVVIFGIFYFMVIRPQQRKQKDHQKFLTELKRGDLIVTSSGIIGTIRTLSEKFVTLEVDDKVCLKILKGQIAENANTLKEEAK